MLRHVVCLSWREGTTDEQIDLICDALGALPGAIPEIRAYSFGADAALVDGNAQFAIVGDFDDAAAWHRYQQHPAHQRVLHELIRPLVAARSAAQFEVDR